MSSRETLVHATELIEGEGCYFGIFDSASPANTLGKWDDEFQAAKRMAGRQEWSALLHLNQSWIDLAREGALLSWITLFDGVFKVEVRILAEEPKIEFGEEEKKPFLEEGKENLLSCPSGNIVVDSRAKASSIVFSANSSKGSRSSATLGRYELYGSSCTYVSQSC